MELRQVSISEIPTMSRLAPLRSLPRERPTLVAGNDWCHGAIPWCCDPDTSFRHSGAPRQRRTRNLEIVERDSGFALRAPRNDTERIIRQHRNLAKRCCNIGDRPEEDQWIVFRGNEAASDPERSSFDVNRVDDQSATSNEARGRDTALQRMLEQAGANSLADPILIGRKLSEQQARDGVGRLTGSDRPRQA